MARQPSASGDGRTRRRIAKLLKTEGPMDAARLASRLRVTPMAVRQHLYALQAEKLVSAEERSVPIGRPAKYWQLTREADRLFPDAYAELSLTLLTAASDAYGPEGVERLLKARLARQQADYANRIARSAPLPAKLAQLARVRSEDGYMAEVQADGPSAFLLLENHCPICAAATSCQGYCTTELDLFRSVLGPDVNVERVEHIVAGARRCAYRITSATDAARTRS